MALGSYFSKKNMNSIFFVLGNMVVKICLYVYENMNTRRIIWNSRFNLSVMHERDTINFIKSKGIEKDQKEKGEKKYHIIILFLKIIFLIDNIPLSFAISYKNIQHTFSFFLLTNYPHIIVMQNTLIIHEAVLIYSFLYNFIFHGYYNYSPNILICLEILYNEQNALILYIKYMSHK